MGLLIKPGVKLDKLTPQALLIPIVATPIYGDLGRDCVITSGNDGKHKPGSKHGQEDSATRGDAVDLRTNVLSPGQASFVRDELARRLGDQYDVVLESDHIHAEFDPK